MKRILVSLSLLSTVILPLIFHAEEDARDPEPIAPTITSISQLLYGQAPGAGTDVTQHMLRCNDYVNCDVVTLNPAYTHTPFTARVETMMRSIADKIATRAAIPNNSAEVGFVNQTTEPVYKMLSIGATIPGSGLSDSLIGQYRDVIAADYAYVYAAILIWIQLWPPLYAVLNYMASIYAAYDLAAAADLGTGAKALSLQTASTIYSRAISGEAVVG